MGNDPYPGIFKHFEAIPTCENAAPKPTSSEGAIQKGCENDTANISCPAGKKIVGGTIEYGRWNNSICPGANITPTTATKTHTYNIPKYCLNKNNCSVQVTNGNLDDDPYPGYFKHFKVVPKCE